MKSEEFSYKPTLKQRLLEKKALLGTAYSFQKMAEACGVQKTYLSKVLNSEDTHLNADQLFQACEYLNLTAKERDHLLLLLDYNRCHSQVRRKTLLERIQRYEREQAQTDFHLSQQAKKIEEIELVGYYLDPNAQLAHLFLTCPAYAKDPEGIRKRLGLSREKFGIILEKLIHYKIIESHGAGFRVMNDDLHLSAKSPLIDGYKTMLRLKMMEKLQKTVTEKSYNFSVLFSSTPEVQKQIQELFFEFLKKMEKLVKDSPPEEVYQLGFDFLQWS